MPYIKTGYYKDNQANTIALCYKTETEVNFFCGVFGPHGKAAPGQWVCNDGAGFRIAVDDSEFQERFTWICEIGTGRIQQHYVDTQEKN